MPYYPLSGTNNGNNVINNINVVDNLKSNDGGSALSANQGRVLDAKIRTLDKKLNEKGEEIDSLEFSAIGGRVTDEQIESVGADKITGELAAENLPEIPIESLPEIPAAKVDWDGFGGLPYAFTFDHITPNITTAEGVSKREYEAGTHVLAEIELLGPKWITLFLNVSARRERGIFNLYVMENGVRVKTLAANVQGNELDPRTSFGGFYFAPTRGADIMLRYRLILECTGKTHVDDYSMMAMWFGSGEAGSGGGLKPWNGNNGGCCCCCRCPAEPGFKPPSEPEPPPQEPQEPQEPPPAAVAVAGVEVMPSTLVLTLTKQ